MTIISIREYRTRDTIEALIDLLERAQEGRLQGLVFAIKVSDDKHRLGFTGDYSRDPAEALMCVTRMGFRLNEMMSDRDDAGPPTKTFPL